MILRTPYGIKFCKDAYLTLANENDVLYVDFTVIAADNAHSGTDFVLFINENAVDIIEKRKKICTNQK